MVSIIMPAYNASKTIIESIESVLKQTYQDWELVIVNDCSRDDTLKIAEGYVKKDSRIKLVNLEKNGGLPNARNTGVNHSSGELVAFLDSDDLWLPEKLAEQVSFHSKNPDIAVSHTDFDAFNSKAVLKRPWKNILSGKKNKSGNLLPALYYKNELGVLTVVLKKEVFQKVNGFDTSLWTFEDQDLWIRIAEHGYKFGYINKKRALYRVGLPNSISQTIGKYKKAHKALINKHNSKIKLKDRVWGNYFRHYGTSYFKRRQYKLANLYFLKSLPLHGLSFISATTAIYMLYSYACWFFKRAERN